MVNINDVAGAYLNTQKQLSGGGAAPQPQGGGVSFGDLLKTSVEGAINAQHTGEKVSAKAIIGQADMTDVLQAVNNAEMALNTVLAIRDKVVHAYEEILRTPI